MQGITRVERRSRLASVRQALSDCDGEVSGSDGRWRSASDPLDQCAELYPRDRQEMSVGPLRYATAPRAPPCPSTRPTTVMSQIHCPLCESPPHSVGLPLDVRDVARRLGLAAEKGELFTWESSVTEHPVTTLVTCGCGFQYFFPSIVGTPLFYERLEEAGAYYTTLRWDQRVAIHELGAATRLTDFGCGSGAFVRAAADLGLNTVGVDFNPASSGGSDGEMTIISASADDLHRLAKEVRPADVVTAFQVLEHVSDPIGLLRGLASLTVSGGRVIVSVPNRDRFEVDRIQLLDCPPHHQTRWRPLDLERAGDRARLRIIEVRAERNFNPLRVLNRLGRRALSPALDDWPLPPAGRPWPPSHILNGQNLVAFFST